jgi:hypothetical protein
MPIDKIKPVCGYTLEMMAEGLGLEPNTVKQRLFVAGERPITTKAIWSKKSFKRIENVVKGRPAKKTKKSITRKDGD